MDSAKLKACCDMHEAMPDKCEKPPCCSDNFKPRDLGNGEHLAKGAHWKGDYVIKTLTTSEANAYVKQFEEVITK